MKRKNLTRQELQKWIQRKYRGRVADLAAEARISRQAAHYMLTKGTLPKLETLENMGIEAWFEVDDDD